MPPHGEAIEVHLASVKPFAEGHAFGSAGAYERVRGTVVGTLDTSDPRNAGIVNLGLAPRNAQGRVAYEADFYLLRPADPARGNGKLVYEVNNRGRKLLFALLMDSGNRPNANDPAELADVGNGLLLRMGYTLAWSGWDPEAPRTDEGLAMQAVIPRRDGKPLVRIIRDELVSGSRGPAIDAFRLSYGISAQDKTLAMLTYRRREADTPVALGIDQWEYAGPRSIRLLPAGTKPEPGALYDFRYPAKDPAVLGIGFAVTRDFVSFLRYTSRDALGQPNPVGGIRAAFGIGISQSGRYLRDHIGQGFNQDTQGRKVFDGVLTHVSGVGRVFLNWEFGQPSRTNTQHEDHTMPENAFPFSAAVQTDPYSNKSGALLRGNGFDPLLIEVNTSTEYWQKGASLLHTDALGQKDVALPTTARVFHVAGTQHGGRAGMTDTPGPCANPRNPHSPGPALRALFVALDQWVTEGKEPPPSRVATISSGTLVRPDQVNFPALPGFARTAESNAIITFGDWVNPKIDPARTYRHLVPQVDADGNEVAGILLPDIAAPLATYTGWNVYKAPYPAPDLCDREGSYLPFAATEAQRNANQDPRPSLEARYGDADGYVVKLAQAAQALVRDRLLLQEDADRYIAQAKAAYLAVKPSQTS